MVPITDPFQLQQFNRIWKIITSEYYETCDYATVANLVIFTKTKPLKRICIYCDEETWIKIQERLDAYR